MDDIVAIKALVSQVRPFADWPAEIVERLCRTATIETYEAGQYVYRMDDPPKGLWIVREGWFQVSRTGANGKRSVLDHQQPGQITGIVGLFDRMGAPFDVQARVAASMVFLPEAAVMAVLEEDPRLMFSVAALLCRRTRLDYARHFTISFSSPRAIIARTILYMLRGRIRSNAAQVEVPVHIPQQDIASLWDMSRQKINAEMTWFVKQKILTMRYRRIVALDVTRLLKLVTDEQPLDQYELSVLFPNEKFLNTAM